MSSLSTASVVSSASSSTPSSLPSTSSASTVSTTAFRVAGSTATGSRCTSRLLSLSPPLLTRSSSRPSSPRPSTWSLVSSSAP
ncbi:hypothetical protein BN1708_020201, partial [Verticillium longisporum]